MQSTDDDSYLDNSIIPNRHVNSFYNSIIIFNWLNLVLCAFEIVTRSQNSIFNTIKINKMCYFTIYLLFSYLAYLSRVYPPFLIKKDRKLLWNNQRVVLSTTWLKCFPSWSYNKISNKLWLPESFFPTTK